MSRKDIGLTIVSGALVLSSAYGALQFVDYHGRFNAEKKILLKQVSGLERTYDLETKIGNFSRQISYTNDIESRLNKDDNTKEYMALIGEYNKLVQQSDIKEAREKITSLRHRSASWFIPSFFFGVLGLAGTAIGLPSIITNYSNKCKNESKKD